MPGHDCVTAVGQLQDMITREADNKSLTAIIMLDQKAAYDLVDHIILLGKLKHTISTETQCLGLQATWMGEHSLHK